MKFSAFIGNLDLISGVSLEPSKKDTVNPVVKIIGNGVGWAKETNGQVTITGTGERTVVEVSGPGAWKIKGKETFRANTSNN